MSTNFKVWAVTELCALILNNICVLRYSPARCALWGRTTQKFLLLGRRCIIAGWAAEAASRRYCCIVFNAVLHRVRIGTQMIRILDHSCQPISGEEKSLLRAWGTGNRYTVFFREKKIQTRCFLCVLNDIEIVVRRVDNGVILLRYQRRTCDFGRWNEHTLSITHWPVSNIWFFIPMVCTCALLVE